MSGRRSGGEGVRRRGWLMVRSSVRLFNKKKRKEKKKKKKGKKQGKRKAKGKVGIDVYMIKSFL